MADLDYDDDKDCVSDFCNNAVVAQTVANLALILFAMQRFA